MCLLYFILDDIKRKKSYMECLVAKETKCELKSDNDTRKDNLMLIFRHLLSEHAAPHDSITRNFTQWCDDKRVRS